MYLPHWSLYSFVIRRNCFATSAFLKLVVSRHLIKNSQFATKTCRRLSVLQMLHWYQSSFLALEHWTIYRDNWFRLAGVFPIFLSLSVRDIQSAWISVLHLLVITKGLQIKLSFSVFIKREMQCHRFYIPIIKFLFRAKKRQPVISHKWGNFEYDFTEKEKNYRIFVKRFTCNSVEETSW